VRLLQWGRAAAGGAILRPDVRAPQGPARIIRKAYSTDNRAALTRRCQAGQASLSDRQARGMISALCTSCYDVAKRSRGYWSADQAPDGWRWMPAFHAQPLISRRLPCNHRKACSASLHLAVCGLIRVVTSRSRRDPAWRLPGNKAPGPDANATSGLPGADTSPGATTPIWTRAGWRPRAYTSVLEDRLSLLVIRTIARANRPTAEVSGAEICWLRKLKTNHLIKCGEGLATVASCMNFCKPSQKKVWRIRGCVSEE
jgi:hypothetical protein